MTPDQLRAALARRREAFHRAEAVYFAAVRNEPDWEKRFEAVEARREACRLAEVACDEELRGIGSTPHSPLA